MPWILISVASEYQKQKAVAGFARFFAKQGLLSRKVIIFAPAERYNNLVQ